MTLRGAARAAYNARYYEAHRNTLIARTRRRHALERMGDRPFVAIDSEGVSFGDPVPIGDHDLARCQRTIFWGAAGMDGKAVFLDGTPYCSSLAILDWLVHLPAQFGKRAIYVWFGSSYDATQIFADMPYERAWELQHARPYGKPDIPARMGRYVLWGPYALSYVKQKCLKIGRLKNPDRPRNAKGRFEFSSSITIYDVFGFFQTSFLSAARSIPGALIEGDEAIIAEGKAARATFSLDDRATMQRYTSVELRVLARMMTRLRDTMDDLDLKLQRWQGAGSIAAAVMKRENVKPHFAPVASSSLSIEQEWAHHAFFGGRIECLKQGRTSKPLWSYDIRSAYPAIMAGLPSMRGGHFDLIDTPSRGLVADASPLSMFDLEFEFVTDDGPLSLNKIYGADAPPFYPFPYRDQAGRITFPPHVRGIYMADEVRAAMDWIGHFFRAYRTRARNAFDPVIRLSLHRALLFYPAPGAGEPFAFLRDMYDERRAIVARAEKTGRYDLSEKILKLAVNSCYGKTAQAVGNAGRPPGTACPWYAAAITAGTRAALVRAALHAPSSIVAFQTDGIVSQKKLDVPIGTELGTWECERIAGTSIFVQPGIYHLGKKSKHRGIKMDLLGTDDFEGWLNRAADRWIRDDAPALDYPYRYYMTLGAALASRERWAFAGWWVDGRRELRMDNLGFKRAAPLSSMARRARAGELVSTLPKPAYYHGGLTDGEKLPMSAPHRPDWLDPDMALAHETDMLNEEIAYTNS